MDPTPYLCLALAVGAAAYPAAVDATPEGRAVAFLAREVPAWPRDNKCFSCHNNADAARALILARRLGYRVPPAALASTEEWVRHPERWQKNGGEGEFNDRRAASLQFAATLAALGPDARTARAAVERVVALQEKDGRWQVGAEGALGSPAAHGATLATALARRTVHGTDAQKKADAWLRAVEVKSVLDAAAVLLGLEDAADGAARRQRERCLALLRKGESRDGGWGPYASSPAEVFDTAVVVLALLRQPPTDETRAMARRGRAYLVREQQPDGSWRETTRPSGGESYAQRIATTGWATQALLQASAPPAPR